MFYCKMYRNIINNSEIFKMNFICCQFINFSVFFKYFNVLNNKNRQIIVFFFFFSKILKNLISMAMQNNKNIVRHSSVIDFIRAYTIRKARYFKITCIQFLGTICTSKTKFVTGSQKLELANNRAVWKAFFYLV